MCHGLTKEGLIHFHDIFCIKQVITVLIAKSFDSCQPARIAQADMGRYFFDDALSPLFQNEYDLNAFSQC